MEDLPVPLSRVELYLAKACGMDVTVPEAPESRLEQYLAILAGDTSVEMPAPMSLTEQWLAYVLGVTPDPLLAVEGACYIDNQKVDVRYFAVAAGMPGAVLPPAPQNRKEQYFANLNVGPTGVLKYATGTNIALTDVVRGIEELQYVYGDTFQQTYSGKNLMPYNTYDASNSRVMNLPDLILPIGTFTISFDLDSYTLGTSSGINILLYLVDENRDSSYSDGSGNKTIFTIDSSTQIGRYSYTFTTKAITHKNNTNIRMGATEYDNGARCKLTNIQIEVGSTPTTYEQYVGGVPAPNPDYPQAVQTVTGEQSVWVHGKNLANPQTFIDWIDTTYDLCLQYSWGNEDTRPKYGVYQGRNHVARFSGSTLYTVRDNMTNPTYDEARIIYQNLGFKENTRYTISFDIYSTGSGSATNLQFLYTDGTTSNISGASQNTWAHCAVKSQSGKTISCIRINYLTGMVYLDLDTLQIEEGDATTYEPYQGANYTINLGSTELCKIGNYQDYIYKSGDDWYVHKDLGKIVLDGSETWTAIGGRYYWVGVADAFAQTDTTVTSAIVSNHFIASSPQAIYDQSIDYGISFHNSNGIRIRDKDYIGSAKLDAFKTWLSGHNTIVYYQLATPTDTKITDNTLIGQLNAVGSAVLPKPNAYIEVSADSTNLPGSLKISYYGEEE